MTLPTTHFQTKQTNGSDFSKINLAIIGCGRWGKNHVRTAHGILGKNLKVVCDADKQAKTTVQTIAPGLKVIPDLEPVLNDTQINSVIIATPPATHYDIAKQCLLHDKHVLVEKPITLDVSHARELVRFAKEQNKILMVGHVLLYHPAIIKLKEEINNGRIGKIHYIYSNRLNLGTLRSEENILWSFAPHDISVIQYLTESNPIFIDAKGANFLQNNIEDTTLTYLIYPNNIHAHIFVSWLHPFKEHRLIVVGSRGMLVFEDSLKQDKLKFYPKGFQEQNGGLQKFDGDYEALTYADEQPLANEQKHFFQAILNQTNVNSDGIHAVEVLDILEKAQNKLRKYEMVNI